MTTGAVAASPRGLQVRSAVIITRADAPLPADCILQHLATCSNTWSSLTNVAIICSDGLLPAHNPAVVSLSLAVSMVDL